LNCLKLSRIVNTVDREAAIEAERCTRTWRGSMNAAAIAMTSSTPTHSMIRLTHPMASSRAACPAAVS
jgi:hypothetical protein